MVQRCGVGIETGSERIQVHTHGQEPLQRSRLSIQGGQAQRDLLFRGTRLRSKAIDVIPTFETQGGRQRQHGPALEQVAGCAVVVANQGLNRGALRRGSLFNEYVE